MTCFRRCVFNKWIILLFLITHSVFADSYSTVSDWFGIDPNSGQNSFLTLTIPSGGKYESMSTAYTAIALDSSYMESNAAGSSLLKDEELTFFHNDWIADSSLESAYYTFRPEKNEDFGFGIGFKFLHVPFSGYNDWGAQTENVGWYSESIGTFNMSYGFIKDYYGSNIISVGGNFKIAYRGVSSSLYSGQSAFAIMGDVGIISRFNLFKYYASRDTNFSIGFSVKNLGTEYIDDNDPLPTALTTGIAWKFIRPITLALDFSIPFNLNGEVSENMSGAIGFNFEVTNFLDFQTGFLIKQGQPRFTVGSQVSLKNFDLMVNYTLDLATQMQMFNRLSVGIRINLDSAKGLVIRDEVQELYLNGLDEYSKGNWEVALNYLQEAKQLNSNYQPVLEAIEMINNDINLRNELIGDNK